MTLPISHSRRVLPPLACLLFAALASGCARSAPVAVEEEHPTAPVVAVAPKILVLGERTRLIGTTIPLPNQAARVTATVEGRVVSVLGDGQGRPLAEGQRVEQGQVIAQLDDRVAQANLVKTEALLEEAAELTKQADLAEKLALLDVDRLEKLRPTNMPDNALPLVSRIELEKARAAVQDAQSKQKAAAAKQRALRAEGHALSVQADQLKLRAPITGTLGALQISVGQTLSAGAAVADIINLDAIDVLAYAPQNLAARLALGQPAFLALTDDKAGPTGQLVFLSPQAQADTGNIALKLRFPNGEARLRANLVVNADVLTQPEKKRLTIPDAALQEDQEPPIVVVAVDVETRKNAEGKEEKLAKAKRLQATIGVRDRSQHVVEIIRLFDPETKKNVDPDDVLYLVEGGYGLHSGDELRLEEPHGDEHNHSATDEKKEK
jgi:RND family efflux transporter MFP subunit